MCGRGACTLNSDALSGACGYIDATGKRHEIQWVKKSELKYKTNSCNVGPRDVVPCLLAGTHFGEEEDRILCPMIWGMIPPWHEGDYRKHTMSTHNSRLDRVLHSKLYSTPLRKGYKCIVIFDGYYEWKAGKDKKAPKQPYYIYLKQDNGIIAEDPSTWPNEWCPETGWKGYKPLKMAGLFNIFKTVEGKLIYSCTIITTASNKILSWLHDRIPVFLTTKEQIEFWLDKNVSANEAVERLNSLSLSEDTLQWHPVSTLVNNVMHKSEECRKRIEIKEEQKANPSSTFMASWLKRDSAESVKSKSKNTEDESVENKSNENKKTAKKRKKE